MHREHQKAYMSRLQSKWPTHHHWSFPQRLVMGSMTTAVRKVVSSSTLIGPIKIWAHFQIRQPLALALKFKPVAGLCHTWQKRHWLLRKHKSMCDRKLVGSRRQRSLSSRFILPRLERPLVAGNLLPSTWPKSSCMQMTQIPLSCQGKLVLKRLPQIVCVLNY